MSQNHELDYPQERSARPNRRLGSPGRRSHTPPSEQLAVDGASKKPVSPVLDLLVQVLLIVLCCIAVIFVWQRYVPASQSAASIGQPKIVMLSMDQLVRQQITTLSEKVRKGEFDASQMADKSKHFSASLQEHLRSYADQGVIVLRAESVVAAPEGVEDITDAVRDALVTSGAMLIPAAQAN